MARTAAVIRNPIPSAVRLWNELLIQSMKKSFKGTSGVVATKASRPVRITAARELSEQKRELEAFLYERVYRHPRLIEVRAEAQGRLKQMFELLCGSPERMPPQFQARAEKVGIQRAVGDYLAGMTDRYCDQQYEKLAVAR